MARTRRQRRGEETLTVTSEIWRGEGKGGKNFFHGVLERGESGIDFEPWGAFVNQSAQEEGR